MFNKLYKLPISLIFSFFLILIILSSHEMTSPPAGFDGNSYAQMAQNWGLSTPGQIAGHHAQRIFPSFMVKVVHHFFLNPKIYSNFFNKEFCFLTRIIYFLIGINVFNLLKKRYNDEIVAAGAALSIIISSTYMHYYLNNHFQLTDILTIYFTLLFIVIIKKNHWWNFVILGTLAILTRQNLWILIVSFYPFWLLQRISFPILFISGIFHASIMIFMLKYFPSESTIDTLRLLPDLFPSKEVLKSVYRSIGPFVLLLPFAFKFILNNAKKYYPLYIFLFITLYQPISYWPQTGTANIERIINQSTFFLSLALAIFFLDSLPKAWRKYIIFMPLFLGTRHLEPFMNFTVRPLMIFPNYFKDYIIIAILVFYIIAHFYKKKTIHPLCSSNI